MRFWKPEPIVETVSDPAVAAHEAAVREAYLRGRRDERARHRNSPMIAAAFGLAGLMGATLLIGAVLRGTYEVEHDARLIGGEVTSTARDTVLTPRVTAPAHAGPRAG